MNRTAAALVLLILMLTLPQAVFGQTVTAKNHVKVGKTHLEKGNYQDAEKEFKEALRLEGKYSDAHFLLALTYMSQKKIDDAQKEFEEVVRLEPRFETARLYLASMLLEKKQYDKARDQLNYVITVDPKIAQAFYGLGVVSYMEGDLQKSIDQWNKAVSLNKDYAPAFYNLAGALMMQKKYDDARAQINRAMQLKPNSALYKFGSAWLDYETGKKDSAMKMFDGLTAIAADMPIGFVSEGIMAYEKEDLDRALECAARACEKDNQFQKAYELKGMAHEKAGEWDEAIKAYQEVINLDPNEKDLKKKIDELKAKLAQQEEERKSREQYPNHEEYRKID